MERFAHGQRSGVLQRAFAASTGKGNSRIRPVGRVENCSGKISQTELKPDGHPAPKLIGDRGVGGSKKAGFLKRVGYVTAPSGYPRPDQIAEAWDGRGGLCLDEI